MIKKWVIFMTGLLFIPGKITAQDWQSVLTLDTRSGYSTNTYLNPFLSEWDRTAESGYMVMSPMGQFAYSADRFTTELTGGAILNPFFDERETWTGVFTVAGMRARISDRISAGAEAGVSSFSTIYERRLFWVQPAVIWSPGTFTQVRLKAGPAFRKIEGEQFDEEEQEFVRFNSYTIDFETWKGFRWRYQASVYGNLEDLSGNIGIRGILEFHKSRNLQLSLRSSLDQFQYEMLIQNGGPGGGLPGGGGQPGGDELTEEADRILRLGAGAVYRLNQNLAFTINADYLNYFSTVAENTPTDLHLSAGVQLSLFPGSGRRSGASTEWRQNDEQTIILRLSYSGDGQLYIIGDFNDWQQPGVPLRVQSRNRFVAELELDSGAYEYKILLVDGDEESWIDFSDDTFTVSDGFGGENGLIFID